MIKNDKLISKQEVLTEIHKWSKDEFLRVTNPLDCLHKRINSLLSVTLQPKIGEWLSCAEENGKPVKWICSSCRSVKSITKNKTEFCPACGAKMQMTDKEIVDKLTELTTGTIDHFNFDDAMDLLYEIKRILSRRSETE